MQLRGILGIPEMSIREGQLVGRAAPGGFQTASWKTWQVGNLTHKMRSTSRTRRSGTESAVGLFW